MEAVAVAPTIFDPSKWGQREKDQKDCSQVNKELLKYEIRPDSDYPEMQYFLTHNDVGCFPLGELIGFSGKAKAGKGLSIIFLIVALLRGVWGGFKAERKNIKVMLIDNEQTGYSAQNNLRKIYSLCGWDSNIKNPRINYYCLRDADIKTRRSVLESALNEHRPDVVFIDNVRDLLKDFNSIEESGELVNFLMRLTKQYNVTIVTVLHENKGKDENLRGHLGSELVIKASEVYHVTKTLSNFKVVQTECRNAPIDDWSFELDEQSRPVPTEIERTVSRADTREYIMRGEFAELFKQKDKFRFSELVKAIQEQQLIAERTAKDRITKGYALDIITKDIHGLITLKMEERDAVQK